MNGELQHDNDNPELDGPAPTPSEMAATAKPKTPTGPQLRVPLKSLAMPGDDDKLNNPEMGDTVEFHAQGKVATIDGDNAVVSIDTINGAPVTVEAAKTNDTAAPDEFAELRQQAAGRMI
jgi:hypothetical protein